nr:hypothetical protein [Tanacetum cinerariifolium]
DMLLLLVQGKLTNLTVEERFAFNVSLRMFTRSIVIQRRVEDLQLGVESYPKKLNLTKSDSYRSDLNRKEAYTAYSNLRGFIYQNKDEKNRLMRIDELHKFSDGTLTDVRTALDNRLKGIQMQYLPQSIYRKSDKERAATMIHAIDKRLKTKRIMRSLERFVGERLYLNPMIQPEPEGSTQGYPLVSVEVLRLGDARKVFDEVSVKDTCKGSGSKLGVPVSRLSGNYDSDVDSIDECVFYGDDSSCISELNQLMEDRGCKVECLNEVVKVSESNEMSFDLGSSAKIVSCSGNDIDIETNSGCDHKTHSFSGDEGKDINDIEELKCLNGSMRCSIPAESIEDE